MTEQLTRLEDGSVIARGDAVFEHMDVAGGLCVMASHVSPDKTTGNEDSATAIAKEGVAVLAVADGLGGLPAGDAASGALVKTLVATVAAADLKARPMRGAILDALEKSNNKILKSGLGNATTVALAEVDGDSLRNYYAGDSQILVIGQRGKIKLQTVAHSPTGYAVESGYLDEDEALTHEERHYVDNVVGSAEMSVQMGMPIKLSRFDTVIVATDGLWDNLYVEEIIEITRKGELLAAGQQLMQAVQKRIAEPKPDMPSHADDVTFILYRRQQ